MPPAASEGGRPTTGGRVLAGRYTVGRRIGAGGMATILRASDNKMEREVAIKVLHRHLAHDPEVRTRFKAEARHAASLSHPNIVAVYDQGEADLPYIVMELIDGPSLREVLGRHGPLSPEQTLAVIQPLCLALEAAHGLGLIHRDVKPENVLVTPDGVPKLADFGIARVMAATSHTATGTLVGSVHYLAPELVGGVEATPASDQYALAVVAWELLTGRKPLPAETPMAIALRHASEDIPPASRYAPEVPAALDRVMQRATDRDPTHRYPSMQAFAAAFLGAVPGKATAVTTTGDDGSHHTLILPPDASETLALSTAAMSARAAAEQALDQRRTTPPPRRGGGSRTPPRATSTGHSPVRSTAAPAAAHGPPRAQRRDRTPVSTPVLAPPAPPRERRRARAGVILLVLVLIAGLTAGGGWLYYDQVLAPVAEVPDLARQAQGAAAAELAALGLVMDIDSQEHRLEDPAGTVIGQRPDAGSQLRAGGVVRVVLSLGPQIVDMPELVGRPYVDVTTALQANRFAVAPPVGEFSDTVPAGQVISQVPPPGERVAQGSEVSVVVSLGIEQVVVPLLEGSDQADAEAGLAASRLVVGDVTTEFSDVVPEEGTVIRQGIPPGEEVDRGSAVSLVISSGPLTVETPDVLGLAQVDASAAIEALGLVADAVTEPQQTLGPFTVGSVNVVERQVPAPDEPIARGEVVTIYYFVPRG